MTLLALPEPVDLVVHLGGRPDTDEPLYQKDAHRPAYVYSMVATFERPLRDTDYRQYDPNKGELEGWVHQTDDGWTRDTSHWSHLAYRSVQSRADLEARAVRLWKRSLETGGRDGSFKYTALIHRRLRLEIRLVQISDWWCEWFSHRTFNVDLDDGQLHTNFMDYIWWVKRLPRLPSQREFDSDRICLMGADDTWRWRASDDDRTKTFCRCVHCTKAGVVTVCH